jgi:NAD(P)-dependent dehydrogenase (short-subunit alcohol dehydrogenase family)
LPEEDIFDVEYWILEQAKLIRSGNPPPLGGKIALVTGAAGGIGRACVEALHAQGAAVIALDIDPDITGIFEQEDICGLLCDVTDPDQVNKSVESAARRFGGLDILVSNAGIFPASATIADMSSEVWNRSIEVNLSSHQQVLRACIPYLELGFDAAVVIIGSRSWRVWRRSNWARKGSGST